MGDSIRVVEIDGLVLGVEPEEGGAMDYREMRSSRKGEPEPEANPEAESQVEGPAK